MKSNRKTPGMKLKKSFVVNLSGRKGRQKNDVTNPTPTDGTSLTTSIITVTHLV